MTRAIAFAFALWAATAGAQEIGKELPAPPPPEAPVPPPPPPPQVTTPGPHKGGFGLSASLVGESLAVAPAQVPGQPAPAGGLSPTVGIKFFASDSLSIDGLVGMQIISASQVSFGFGVGAGVSIYLGSKESPLRPVIAVNGFFDKGVSTRGDDFGLEFRAGGGAEYWFNEHFSMTGLALIDLPIVLGNNQTTISLGTFSPAVNANFYF